MASDTRISPDLRSRQAEYKKRLQEPIESSQELIKLLASALDLLGLLPVEINLPDSHFWAGSTQEDRRRALAAVTWISDIQQILIEKVLGDWKERQVEPRGALDALVKAWFAPSASPSSSGDGEIAPSGSIQIASLSSLSTMYSTATLSQRTRREVVLSRLSPLQTAFRPESVSVISQVVTLFATTFSLVAIAASLDKYQTEAKRSLIWNDVIRELLSLPDRAANATNGQVPVELEKRAFVSILARQLVALSSSRYPSSLTAALFSKLQRQGYLEGTSSSTEEPVHLWPSLIRMASEDQTSPSLFSSLTSTARQSVLVSLVSFIDRYSFKMCDCSQLLNNDEGRRPGAEGTLFLSSEAWNKILSVASFLEYVVKSLQGGEDDSESDDESVTLSPLALVLLPLSSTVYWSPLSARLLVHTISRTAKKEELSLLLAKVVEVWSSADRLKRVLWDQEVYLTTTILLLFSEVPPTLQSKLCISSSFISGVSHHLEHLQPNVRRMGMLVAEMVSASSGSEKPLSFGKSMWDGKGEGKEEARVLRALYHGWNGRVRSGQEVSEPALLSAFGLDAKQIVAVRPASPPVMRERPPTSTRKLPVRRAAPHRTKRILIEPIGDEASDELINKEAGQTGLPPLTQIKGSTPHLSESEGSSSSERESEDSEMESMIPPSDAEKKEEFGMGVPQKKRRTVPIYIHQLAPLFQEQEREANKLALKHAEALIKKKARWGGEVDENAVNLSLAIVSFQNNFAFKRFEERRKSALTALVCASPHLVAPCLAEQFFNSQFSMTQRVCILNAMAFGARQLSEGGEAATQSQQPLRTLAEEFSQLSMTRSRIEGEQRLPELQRERSLLVTPQPTSSQKTLDAGRQERAKTSTGTYLDMAGPAFIFPLVSRFHAQLEHHSRTSSARYRNGGSSILFDPFLVGAFLDTLTVLCYCGQNAVTFSTDIVPEVLSLALSITNTALAKSAQARGRTKGGSADEVSSGILGAAANLFLVLLDAVSQVDNGRILIHRHGDMVRLVETWAAAVFESVEAEGGVNRAGSGAAAILLCIDRLRQHQHR